MQFQELSFYAIVLSEMSFICISEENAEFIALETFSDMFYVSLMTGRTPRFFGRQLSRKFHVVEKRNIIQ